MVSVTAKPVPTKVMLYRVPAVGLAVYPIQYTAGCINSTTSAHEASSGGLGTALLSAAIEFARSLPGVTHLHLSVSATAVPALRLYQRMGFVIWGTEEAALQVDGVFIDTHYMVLRLTDTAA